MKARHSGMIIESYNTVLQIREDVIEACWFLEMPDTDEFKIDLEDMPKLITELIRFYEANSGETFVPVLKS